MTSNFEAFVNWNVLGNSVKKATPQFREFCEVEVEQP